MSIPANTMLLESCRASCLSVHTSAGMLTSARKGAATAVLKDKLADAARLMRQAEAMCRAA
eukprot:4021653-Karenia_brevis.AAC.1